MRMLLACANATMVSAGARFSAEGSEGVPGRLGWMVSGFMAFSAVRLLMCLTSTAASGHVVNSGGIAAPTRKLLASTVLSAGAVAGSGRLGAGAGVGVGVGDGAGEGAGALDPPPPPHATNSAAHNAADVPLLRALNVIVIVSPSCTPPDSNRRPVESLREDLSHFSHALFGWRTEQAALGRWQVPHRFLGI